MAGFVAVMNLLPQRIAASESPHFSDLAGNGSANPQLSTLAAILLFSTAGLPPLAGFFGKYYILVQTTQTSPVLTCVIILAAAVSPFYYIRLVQTLLVEWSAHPAKKVVCWSLTKQLILLTVGFTLYFSIIFCFLLALRVGLTKPAGRRPKLIPFSAADQAGAIGCPRGKWSLTSARH